MLLRVTLMFFGNSGRLSHLTLGESRLAHTFLLLLGRLHLLRCNDGKTALRRRPVDNFASVRSHQLYRDRHFIVILILLGVRGVGIGAYVNTGLRTFHDDGTVLAKEIHQGWVIFYDLGVLLGVISAIL